MRPTVTIGIPIYKVDTLFFHETIRSIKKQTMKDFEVVMSVDGSDPKSATICRKYLTDSRFRLHVHTDRLGWLKNTSWLMQNSRGRYWCLMPQDDIIKPTYLATLIDHSEKNRSASVVYSDLQGFGHHTVSILQDSVCGNPLERELTLIRSHLPAVAYRGLVKGSVARRIKSLRSNSINSFYSDTVWMVTLARYGELHRVPKKLYLKRYHSNNTHFKWYDLPPDTLIKAWQLHCRDMFLEALPVAHTYTEKYLLLKASLFRLVHSRLSERCIDPKQWAKLHKKIYSFRFLCLIAIETLRAPRLLLTRSS